MSAAEPEGSVHTAAAAVATLQLKDTAVQDVNLSGSHMLQLQAHGTSVSTCYNMLQPAAAHAATAAGTCYNPLRLT